jgi:hypothetical protein
MLPEDAFVSLNQRSGTRETHAVNGPNSAKSGTISGRRPEPWAVRPGDSVRARGVICARTMRESRGGSMKAFALGSLACLLLAVEPIAVAQTLPTHLYECESTGCGGDWKFTGRTGKAAWPQGVFADLAIQRFDAEQVVIRRTDTGASTRGATAVYTGRVHGHRIDGDVVYNWPGHWGNKPMTLHWYADILDPNDPARTATRPRDATTTPTLSSLNGAFPNLDGVWQVKLPPSEPPMFLALVSQGADVTFVRVFPGETRLTWRGHFSSSTQLAGHSCGNSAHIENPNCLPEVSTVSFVTATHLKDNFGAEMDKIAGPDDIRYSVGLERAKLVNSEAYLPDKPIDIAGVWESPEAGGGALTRISVQQQDGDVTISYVNSPATIVFSGRYQKNPMFSGIGKSKNSLAVEVPYSVFIDDPDHLRLDHEYQSHPYFRVTTPGAHDIPCDAKNRYHVTPVYASIRGQVALAAHADRDAQCWLTVGAEGNIGRAQSLLAALYVRGVDGAAPNYGEAFRLASLSAQQHDLSGELVLAGLFREGKGTNVDPVKARFWEDQAKAARQASLWQLLNTKNAFGVSAVDIVGALMKAAVDDLNDPEAQAERRLQQQRETSYRQAQIRAQYQH